MMELSGACLRSASFRQVFVVLPMLCAIPVAVHAQIDPPWQQAGSPFFGNPIGYARHLHSHYVALGKTIAAGNAALAGYDKERTTKAYATISGMVNGLRELGELTEKRKAARRQIADAESTREALEAEWRRWCELGLLGSPMPPLSAANETIVETYLDESTYPNVQRKRIVDRIDFNIRYFLELKDRPPAATPPATPTEGGGGGQSFPKEPFNGLQVSYGISGAALGEPSDGGPFEGWVRTYTGTLQGPTLSVVGSVTGTASKDFSKDGHITVWAGDKRESLDLLLASDTPTTVTKAYSVSVPVPADATSGGVTVTVRGVFRNGESRFVTVTGSLKREAAPGAAPGSPAVSQPSKPAPQVPARPVHPPAYITLPTGPAKLVPAGSGSGESAAGAGSDGFAVSSGLPLTWDPGDRLVTGVDSPAVLWLPEGDQIAVHGGSVLEFGPEGPRLVSGGALVDPMLHDGPYQVTTPTSLVRTSAGTFGLEVAPDGATLVTVAAGKVRVYTRSRGGETVVPAGSSSLIGTRGLPSAPQPFGGDVVSRHNADIGALSVAQAEATATETPGGGAPPVVEEVSDTPPAAGTGIEALVFVSQGAGDSLLLREVYPTHDVRCSLRISMEEPGTVLDTVGLGLALRGSWALTVNPDGQVQFQVYDPETDSAVNQGGWHVLRSRTRLSVGTPHHVDFALTGGEMRLAIDRKVEARAELATALSGQPVFLGDFPGDQSLPAGLKPSRGLVGIIEVLGFGEIR